MQTLLLMIFFVGIVILSVHLRLLKKQMRNMARDLEKTRNASYNKQMTVQLFDKDLTELAAAFNKNLEYQKNLKLEAEQSQKQLKQSVSDIAHDLRTPITVIKGNLQRLLADEELSEKSRGYLRICDDKTDVLKSMVDDFFELSFLESETLETALARLDLTEFTARFLLENENLIRQKQLEPEIRLPEKSIFIMADEQLLLRMFGNLLNNIIKHASHTFSLSVTEKEKQICICFSNPLEDGDQPDVAHLFDRTYRGDKARTGGGPGGLGLYIVKLLAQKQGAEVRAVRTENTLRIEVYFASV